MINYFKNPLMEEKYSFRVIGKVQDLLADPVKLLILASLVLINGTSFNIAQLYMIPDSVSQPVVLGEAISLTEVSPNIALEMYHLSMTSLVSSYLTSRSLYLDEADAGRLSAEQQSAWLALVKQVKEGVLALEVPAQRQDLHLSVVIALFNEEATLSQKSLTEVKYFESLSQAWENILLQNPWLNES